MTEYRHIETGEVKNQGQWRSYYKNISLPRTWKAATLQSLKLEPVLEAPMPTAGLYQTVSRNGVEQDSNGNWVTAWAVSDMFADTTAEDGTVTTKAEHEAAYQAQLDERAAEAIRTKRNELLAASDWTQVPDAPVDQAAWRTYRQALRDVTTQSGFPHEVTWPVKPE